MLRLSLCPNSTPEEAVLWLKGTVHDIGLGFHPDTAAEDYTTSDGTPSFSQEECNTLNDSIFQMFEILGNELPYSIAEEVAANIRVELESAIQPLRFHDPLFQLNLLRNGSRDEIIRWLCWNDPNGCYSDDDSKSEGLPILSLGQAQGIMQNQIRQDAHER